MKLHFWKNNENDQHFTLDSKEFEKKFKAWLFTREIAWLEYYGSMQVIIFFVGDKSGLSAVTENYETLKTVVGASMWDHIEMMKALKPILQQRVEQAPEKLSLWGVAMKEKFAENKDISEVVGQLMEEYKNDLKSLEAIIGTEAITIMKLLSPA